VNSGVEMIDRSAAVDVQQGRDNWKPGDICV